MDSLEDFFTKKYYLHNCVPDDILVKVNYTNSADLLEPVILGGEDGVFSLGLVTVK